MKIELGKLLGVGKLPKKKRPTHFEDANGDRLTAEDENYPDVWHREKDGFGPYGGARLVLADEEGRYYNNEMGDELAFEVVGE